MLEVRFREDSRKRLSSVFAEGHAGWADAGEDIVCAAVSALLQGAWLGLTEYLKIDVRASRTAGRLALRLPAAARDRPDARAILETAALAIERIATQYPDHVRFAREPEP